MPRIQLKALVVLNPGDRLLYDCPLMSQESFQADAFFKKYRHKIARFVGYLTHYVGPNDFLGRDPGEYLDSSGIRVVFDGETEERELNHYHFVALPPDYDGSDPERWLKSQRVGDLPEKVAFLPLDVVRLEDDLLRQERRIKEVSVDSKTGLARYTLRATPEERAQHDAIKSEHRRARVISWFTTNGPIPSEMTHYTSAQLVLVKKGPLALMQESRSAEEVEESLESPSDALPFWTKYCCGKRMASENRPATLEEAIVRIENGNYVFIDDHDGILVADGGQKVIDLSEIASQAVPYLERVRKLSLEYWRGRLAQQNLKKA